MTYYCSLPVTPLWIAIDIIIVRVPALITVQYACSNTIVAVLNGLGRTILS